ACIQFKNANASRLEAKGMTFSCTPVGGTMANEIIEIRAYTWDDVFTDISDPNAPAAQSAWSLTQVGSGLYFYLDDSEESVNINLEFDEAPISMIDDQRYLFCVYNASDSLRISFDAQIDYFATVN